MNDWSRVVVPSMLCIRLKNVEKNIIIIKKKYFVFAQHCAHAKNYSDSLVASYSILAHASLLLLAGS